MSKKNIFIILLFFIFFIIACKEKKENSSVSIVETYSQEISKIKDYAKAENFNQNIALMIDYAKHSGKYRFFVVDLKNDSILHKALVCHGSCKGKNGVVSAKHFSNKADSYCTSLGMAVVAERAYSSWAKNYKYWLDGLEESNSNMRSRVVVLHAWKGVPDQEIAPAPLAMSWGCPTVSIQMLDTLDAILKKEKKVLLYSFVKE